MTRAIVIALGLALASGLTTGIGTALAQPAPAPTPKPDPKPDSDVGDKTDTLHSGSDNERPWAKGVSQDKQDIAVKLFTDGNTHLNDGIFAKAVDVYREALKSWDHPAIHYNMAIALTKLDKPIDVEVHLQKAISHGQAPLETAEKFEHAKDLLLINAKQLAWIDVTCSKLGAKVSIDNKEVFVVEKDKPNRYQARITIGKHTVIAEKTGYNAQVDATYIEPGQTFRIELKLYTSEELTRYTRRWKARWMPFAVIGGGVLVAGVGGLMERSAQSSYDDFDAEVARCNTESNNNGCESTAALTDMKKSGDTKRTLGYVGYGLAGAAIVTGAILVYLNRETSYEITADEYKKQLAKKQVSFTPLVVPGMAGAMIHGRF